MCETGFSSGPRVGSAAWSAAGSRLWTRKELFWDVTKFWHTLNNFERTNLSPTVNSSEIGIVGHVIFIFRSFLRPSILFSMRCPKCLHKLSNIKLLIAVCTVESIQKELQGDQELMIKSFYLLNWPDGFLWPRTCGKILMWLGHFYIMLLKFI